LERSPTVTRFPRRAIWGAVAVALVTSLSGSTSHARSAAPDPRGLIAFTWANADFIDEEIGVVRADGACRRLLTDEVGFSVASAWSPDGRRIAFSSSRSAPQGPGNLLPYSELYVMNADGSNVQRITRNVNLIDFQAAWSPDGRRIVVARGSGDPPPPGQLAQPTDLWIIDLATGRERQLTNSPSTWEWFAHWSPDGRRIAFEGDLTDPGGAGDVYTINVDGTGLRQITTDPAYDGDAHYSPDGRLLLFDSDRTGNLDVFVMRTDGTGVLRLTRDPSVDLAGSFSPDQQYIAFTSDRNGGQPDVFRMRADGSMQTNLTRTPEEWEFDPDWQPR
jgi:Tol biopolymer transport system component